MFSWLAVVEWLFARPELTLAHVHTSADGLTVPKLQRDPFNSQWLMYIYWVLKLPIQQQLNDENDDSVETSHRPKAIFTGHYSLQLCRKLFSCVDSLALVS